MTEQPEPVEDPAAAPARPPVESVGHPLVDEALDGLRDLDDLDVTQHAARFDQVHGVLRDVLSAAGRADAADRV